MRPPGRTARIWLFLAATAGVATGLWVALTTFQLTSAQTTMQAAGVILIITGLMLMSRFAVRRPVTEQTRLLRVRLSIVGASNVVYGVSLLVPGVTARLILMGVGLLMMLASWNARVGRFFVES